MFKLNKKTIAVLISVFFVIIVCGVVFAFQGSNDQETNKKDLIKEFGGDGIRSLQAKDDAKTEDLKNYETQAVLADDSDSGENDDSIKNQKRSITQTIDFAAKVGKKLFGIEKENFFRPVNRMAEFKNLKAPKVINVPEEYATIQAAIDNANPGDTIKVAGGEYAENIIMKEGVNLIGSNKLIFPENEEEQLDLESSEIDLSSSTEQMIEDETIISGEKSGNVVEFKNGITNETKLAGFTIKNSGENLSGILIENSSPLINDNILKDNEYGIYVKGDSFPVIQKNVINFNNKGIQIYNFVKEETEMEPKTEEISTSATPLSSPIIIDNLITDNKIGIDLYNSSAVIDHNTISYNNHYKTYLGPTFGIYILKSSAEIKNNIITDNGICDLCAGISADEESENVVIGYNDIWGNKNNFVCFGECLLEENNLSEDPNFVDCVAGDFRLEEESGLIGEAEDELDMGVRW